MVSGGADGLVEVWNFKPQIRPFNPIHSCLLLVPIFANKASIWQCDIFVIKIN